MATAATPVNSKSSWILNHPRLVIGMILLGCLAPFINKAIHVDDVLFVWTGQWIQKHPTDFFGFKVNWWLSLVPMWVANWNPPLMSYFLAGVAWLFGWHESVLHLACLGVAFLAAIGIYSLAQMWCERPLLATVVAIFTPVFLVSSTTLMSDVLMLTFWIWALVIWERAPNSKYSGWQFAGAGALAGLAVLSKFSAVTLLPLLPCLSILRTRKAGWWLLGLAVPFIMLGTYEWMTARMYGRGLFSVAAYQAENYRFFDTGEARGILGLAFAGGSVLPLLFFAPWLWRWRTLLLGGIAVVGALLVTLWSYKSFGLMWSAPGLMHHRRFLLQMILLMASGIHLLLLLAVEVWRRRDVESIVLALWIGSGLYFAAVTNWTVSARSFLPLVPAAAILLVRRLTATSGNAVAGDALRPLILAAAVALSLVIADYQLANSARTAAEQIMARYHASNRTVWFQGHDTFQYYMEKLGGRPIDVEHSVLRPSDILVMPQICIFNTLPPGSVGWVEQLQYAPFSWANLMGGTEGRAAGFYDANSGPVPFLLTGFPPQIYFVVKVFSRVEFNSQPANPQEIEEGAVPNFVTKSISAAEQTAFQAAFEGEITRAGAGSQLEQEGKLREAIQYYRASLQMTPNNPVVLNKLAWILASASPPELRNGKDAVQFATRAVELTEYRYPGLISTLAAAYAEAGRFPEAVQTAWVAQALALITGENDVLAANARLLARYASGQTADTPQAP